MLDPRRLAAFVAVADEGGFTRAAERLGVVQSAVSGSVRRLEDELGVELFERSTHAVRLTSAGAAVLPAARAVLRTLDAVHDAAAQAAGGLRGRVVMGTMQAQALRTLDIGARLASFQAAHPGVEVVMRHLGGSQTIAEGVRDGQLDLAFVALPRAQLGDLDAVPVARERMGLAVPADHPLAGRDEPVTLAELVDERFVDAPDGWGTRISGDAAFAAAGLSREIAYEVNDVAAVAELVGHGLGVALLPPSVLDGVPGVRLVPVRDDVEMATSIVVSRVRRPSAAAAALLQAMRAPPSAPA